MTAAERPTVRAHREVAAVLRPGDVAVDATAGNGHDTVFLAAAVGEQGRVVAFDLQPAAIAAAAARVCQAGMGPRVRFVTGSHARLAEEVAAGGAMAVMFNLGYLPGGDHAVITRTDETLRALDAAVRVLKPGGVLTIVCYPGHAGGDEESAAVLEWGKCHGAEVIRREETLRPAPFLVLVRNVDGPATPCRQDADAP